MSHRTAKEYAELYQDDTRFQLCQRLADAERERDEAENGRRMCQKVTLEMEAYAASIETALRRVIAAYEDTDAIPTPLLDLARAALAKTPQADQANAAEESFQFARKPVDALTVPRIELGCPGHLIVASRCRWKRHTQVGNYRISSIGDYYPDRDGPRETIGAGEDAFYETLVFRTTDTQERDNEGCGCRAVVDYCEIDGERYATAGEAQAGHERYVAKYAAQVDACEEAPLDGARKCTDCGATVRRKPNGIVVLDYLCESLGMVPSGEQKT